MSRVPRRFARIVSAKTAQFFIDFGQKIAAPRTRNDCKTCAGSPEARCRRAASIKLVCVIVRCAVRRKCAQFSAKTARIAANFCNVFERDASTLLAKLAEKHVTCLVQRRAHHDSVFVVVSHVCRAFRADLRGLFRRKPRDFSLISTENRSATHAQRLKNMRRVT